MKGVANFLRKILAPGTAALALMLVVFLAPTRGQSQNDKKDSSGTTTAVATDTPAAVNDDPPATMFPHAEWDRLWLSGQVNIISQWHPAFHSPYQGKNSLTPEAQDATSHVLTLYTGLRLTHTTELLFDVQETGGQGLGQALGVAGFFNLDVVRNPTLSRAPYVARLMWHQIIPLGRSKVASERTPYSLFRELPERRLELRFGKLSLVDYFDLNTYGTDSNFQFLNWAVDNNGAYDYAADTRGYTFGALLEYHDKNYILRFAEGLMPKVANGINLDADISRARSENFEVELHGRIKRNAPMGILRLLSYVNHGNMGDYRDAVNSWLANRVTPAPDIANHPLQTTVKYGFGINFEQPLTNSVGVFGRWGWNEGQHESFAYTEVDQTWQIGVGGNGARWSRKDDRLGMVFVSNGISHDHAVYLGYGGTGFLLGDGKLNYARENILESYYALHAWRGVYPGLDLQYVMNPGYNVDRGPVFITSLRLHVEF